jgi:hypothetical protein
MGHDLRSVSNRGSDVLTCQTWIGVEQVLLQGAFGEFSQD